MKKIGILTFHRAENYGAVLQAYALQEKLSKDAMPAEFIDYRNENIEAPYKFFYIKGKSIKGKIKTIISDFMFLTRNLKRKKAFTEFYNKNIKMSESFSKVEEFKDNYDLYITGSDQVWNSSIVGELSDVYTLNFKTEKDSKKISYAASIGNSFIEENQKEIYKKKISKIDAISVREEEAKKALNSIIDNKIEVVLDPTLLLTKEDWIKEVKNCININEKYILAYVITPDEEYLKIVNLLSEKTGLKVVHFGKRNPGYKNVLKTMYTARTTRVCEFDKKCRVCSCHFFSCNSIFCNF